MIRLLFIFYSCSIFLSVSAYELEDPSLVVYEEPAYFTFYENELGAHLLKRCQSRLFPPDEGQSCQTRPKSCLWGEQTCPAGVYPQPTKRCNCYHGVWTCQPFECPTIPTECPLNDPSVENPLPVCSTDLTCPYEQQTCCERTFSKKFCFCQTGTPIHCEEIDICSSADCSTIDEDLNRRVVTLREHLFHSTDEPDFAPLPETTTSTTTTASATSTSTSNSVKVPDVSPLPESTTLTTTIASTTIASTTTYVTVPDSTPLPDPTTVGGTDTSTTTLDEIFPSGPYITVATANERIIIPSPPKPPAISRTNCPHQDQGLFDWHNPSTWGESTVPSTGDIILPDNARVIVRQTISTVLGIVTIPASSELIFDENESGILFDAFGIKVQGNLTIGSESCRVETPVTITLHGTRPSDVVTNIPPPANKGISVTGILNLHGKRFYRTWSRLALTVEPGDNVLMIQDEVNWTKGQEIVLVTTAMKDSREWHRNEIAIVQDVIENPALGVGTAVILENPLSYQHVANGGYQGEVGLLTRLVKIQGNDASEPTDPDPLNCEFGTTPGQDRYTVGRNKGRPCPNTELTGYGGHVMIHGGGKGYVEGVELYRMGQTNVLARYPMHFHLLGDQCQDCYFRDSSVHRSFYRCVSIHGTHYTTVSENVAYDVTGFCYYLEDGVEHDNRIEFNLGAHIHLLGPEPAWGPSQDIRVYEQSDTLTLPADVSASAFYITNIHNYLIGNAASGGYAGFAFPILPKPIGLHRLENVAPARATGLTIDGNTAHSSGWWWKGAATFYWGGTLYYEGDTLSYNPGRDRANKRNPCLVDKCVTQNDCRAFCFQHEEAYVRVTNTKAYLTPSIGFSSWSGRMEVLGFECHDCALSMQALSYGFWANKVLVVCRTKTPIALPEGSQATDLLADGFRWYDTNQEHIITDAIFRNCGYRSDALAQYDQNPDRGCGDEPDIGCRPDSTTWSMLTFSDTNAPEMMQGTRAIFFQNCGRRFGQVDFRNTEASSISGRLQNWYDADGSITGFGESSVIASGSDDAGRWWQIDNEVVNDAQGPLRFFKLTTGPQRGLAHFKMLWDTDLHSQVGKTQCGNGNNIPCDYMGYIKHVGKYFDGDKGLPVTAAASIVGPVGGFAWKLELLGGAPKSVRFEEIEVSPETPLLLSIAYPVGTSFNITAHSFRCHGGTVTCSETFHQVRSIADVRSSLGNTYHVDVNGVLTFRIIQTPQTYVGNPEFFLPQWSDVGYRWGREIGFAIRRFERDGVRLPRFDYGPYLLLEADCPSLDGVYCSQPASSYDPDVCPIGFTQIAYDACSSVEYPAAKYYADGSFG